jgi:hypothetical protein
MEDEDVPILASRPDPFGDRDDPADDSQPKATAATASSAYRPASEEKMR